MKVDKLDKNNLGQFIAFCRKYKTVHDASYLYEDEDLKVFEVSDDNPTLIILENGKITGAFSIMAADYRDKGSVRVRIFYCENKAGYKILLVKMRNLCAQTKKDISGVHLFIPDNAPAAKTFMSLEFTVSSKSYRMVCDTNSETPKHFTMEKGFSLCPLNKTNTAQWKNIYDGAFAYSNDNSPISHESLLDDLASPYVLPDGMMMICRYNKAVGLTVLSKDDNNIAEIETLAVLPEYQGMGIGMMLLQYGIITITQGGHGTPTLSVSSQRDNALHLYKKAGFALEKTFLVLKHSWQKNM